MRACGVKIASKLEVGKLVVFIVLLAILLGKKESEKSWTVSF